MIHMGSCVGKQLLRALYYLGEWAPKTVGAFAHLRNDLDQRDFVAIGAGAGISAAFFAPISATLFVSPPRPEPQTAPDASPHAPRHP